MNANTHRPTGVDDAAELARLMPAPAVQGLDADRQRMLREHLMQQLHEPSEAGVETATGTPRPNRRRLLWGLAPVTAVAAAVVGVLAIGGVTGGGTVNTGPDKVSDDAAGQLLERFALVAEQQPAGTVRDDQYAYVKSLVSFAGISEEDPKHVTVTLDDPYERQIWLSVNGAKAGRLTAADRPKLPSVLDPNPKPSLNTPTYRYLESLPTDPDALLALLYAGKDDVKNSREQKAFDTIGDLLTESIAPPKLTAALYRAAAKIPGVVVVKDATDAAGRHGVAVARLDEATGARQEWIFNKATSTYLGLREVQVNASPDGIAAGTLLGETAVLKRAIVDSTTQTG